MSSNNSSLKNPLKKKSASWVEFRDPGWTPSCSWVQLCLVCASSSLDSSLADSSHNKDDRHTECGSSCASTF